jgi:hypothetical protein
MNLTHTHNSVLGRSTQSNVNASRDAWSMLYTTPQIASGQGLKTQTAKVLYAYAGRAWRRDITDSNYGQMYH